MKKLVLLGTLALSLNVLAAEANEFESRFNALEKEYSLLMQKEQQKFDAEKKVAEQAQGTLAKQKEMYAQLSAKVAKLNEIKDIKFYKEQYEELAKKYQTVLKELESQMAEQQGIINRFKQLEALKVGNTVPNKK